MEGDSISTWCRVENQSDTGSDTGSTGRESISDIVSSPQTPINSPASLDSQSHEQDEIASAFKVGNIGRIPAGFNRLPPEVIERILYVVDANAFASLALVNSQWRRVSDCTELYRYHLAHCRTAVYANGESTVAGDLVELKRKFLREARRNVFEIFRRPQQTLVKLISASTSSSSAFPQGEAFRFIFSARGHILLALSSSRIVVINLTTDPITICCELKTLRRPMTATILDDASLLAVLSWRHQAHVYYLAGRQVKLVQTIMLDEVPRTLTLSPNGTVLAIAYDGGVEVHAIGVNALSTDRRAVRCFDIDALKFSADTLTLVGSSLNPRNPNFVVISPSPYTESNPDLPLSELHGQMWTSQILFPEIKAGYSHATLSVNEDGTNSIVGYDSKLRAFRLSQIDEVDCGTTYFVGPGGGDLRSEPKPNILPATCCGDLSVMGFQDSGIWLYGIPDTSDHPSRTATEGGGGEGSSTAHRIFNRQQKWGFTPPDNNSDRLMKSVEPPRYFVHGYPLSYAQNITGASWVDNFCGDNGGIRRLVAVAPGGVTEPCSEMGEENLPIDGGRLLIFDFARSLTNGKDIEITIEVGEVEPVNLPENNPNLDTEVELERKRTQMKRRRGIGLSRNAAIERSASLARHRASIGPSTPTPPPPSAPVHRNSVSQPSSPTDIETAHVLQSFENPYSNTQPRSRETLQRAATAAAANRGRHRYPNAGFAPSRRLPNRQPLVPHESDADNWVPPPPPYTPDADAPLPEHLRRTLLPSATEPAPRNRLRRSQTSRLETMTQNAMQRTRSTVERMGTSRRGSRSTENANETAAAASPADSRPPQRSRNRAMLNRRPKSAQGQRNISPSTPSEQTVNGPTQRRPSQPALTTDHHSETVQWAALRPMVPGSSTFIDPLENSASRRLSGTALMKRLEEPTPPVPRPENNPPQPQPHTVIGRHGPPLPLLPDLNASLPTAPQLSQDTTQYRPFHNPPQTAPEGFHPTTLNNPPPPRSAFPPRISSRARSVSSASHDPTHQNMSPYVPPPIPSTAPAAMRRHSLHPQSNPLSNRTNGTKTLPTGLGRSRSRSQDIPRRKPVPHNSNILNLRGGRMISSSQSEAGLGRATKTEDLRARIDEWAGEGKRKKESKYSKCIVM